MHVKGQERCVIPGAAVLMLTVVTSMDETLAALLYDLQQEYIR